VDALEQAAAVLDAEASLVFAEAVAGLFVLPAQARRVVDELAAEGQLQ
jgi:hypothetical protein